MMFRRAAAASAKRLASLSTPSLLSSTGVRSISSLSATIPGRGTLPVPSDPLPTGAEYQPEPEATILSEYGAYPLLGLGATALLSKELIMMNEGLFMAVNFSLFYTAAYFTIGDSLAKFISEDHDAYRARIDSAHDVYIRTLELSQDKYNAFTQMPAALESFNKEFQAAAVELQQAQSIQLRHNYRRETLVRLQRIADAERAEAMAAQLALVSDAADAVRDNFGKNKTLQVAAIDSGIDQIGEPKAVEGSKDPVRKEFLAYFSKK